MYSKILVPIDDSQTSRKAMHEAARLARLSKGQIRLLHVIEPIGQIVGYETSALYLSELQPVLREEGRQLLAKAKAELDTDDLQVEIELQESTGPRVAEVIVEQARHWNAELIVLGTHGRRGIGRLMMGSDAEQVVRISPVPVLLVRHKE